MLKYLYGVDNMLPAEKLRLLISSTYNVDLEKYAWSEDLKVFIFSIKLDKMFEPTLDTLGEVYNLGLNIGHCGLTSRYFIRNIKKAELHYGTMSLLIGTKNSPTGKHVWAAINDFLIDPTLMICIPLDKIAELGYDSKKVIAKENDTILSEYDTFENELWNYNNNPNFQDSIFSISRN